MTALIVILCIAIFIAFLLSTRIVLRIKHEETLVVYLRILFIKIKLHPSKKKEKKKRYPHSMSRRKAEKIKKSLTEKEKKKKKKGTPKDAEHKVGEKEEKSDVLTMLSIMTEFIKNFIRLFMRSVRIKVAKLHIIVASDSAAKTAILYGAVSQSVDVLFPLLEGVKNFKKLPSGNDLSVTTDFLVEKPTVKTDITLYVTVGGALKTLIVSGSRTFKKVMDKQTKNQATQKKQRKK